MLPTSLHPEKLRTPRRTVSGQSHAEPKVWVVMTSALAALPLAFCHSFEFPETSSVGESVQTTGVMQHLPPTYPVPG